MDLRYRPSPIGNQPRPVGPRLVLFGFFISLSVIGFLLDRAEAYVFDEAREVIDEITAPFYNLVAVPLRAIRDLGGSLDSHFRLQEENELLQTRIDELEEWRDVALKLERKLARYEALLNMQIDPSLSFVSGRVISDTKGPFVRTLLLDVGTLGGIAKGDGVVNGDGLVGRVLGVSERSSRILLVTDLNSRIPVRIEPFGYRAILAGDNSGEPQLLYLPRDLSLDEGSRVVTSGHGGLLPSGLPVGVVTGTERSGYRVKLSADLNRTDYVRVLNFRVEPFVESEAGYAGQDEEGQKGEGEADPVDLAAETAQALPTALTEDSQ